MGKQKKINMYQNRADVLNNWNTNDFMNKSDVDFFSSLVQPVPQQPAQNNEDWQDAKQDPSWIDPSQDPYSKNPAQPSITVPYTSSSIATPVSVVPNNNVVTNPSSSMYPTSNVDSSNFGYSDQQKINNPYTIQIDPAKWANGKHPNCQFKGRPGHFYNLFSGDGFDIQGKYELTSENSDIGGITEATIRDGNDNMIFNKNGEAFFNDVPLTDGYDLRFGNKHVNFNQNNLNIASSDSDNRVNLISTSDGIRMALSGMFQDTTGLFAKMFVDGWDYAADSCDEFDIML